MMKYKFDNLLKLNLVGLLLIAVGLFGAYHFYQQSESPFGTSYWSLYFLAVLFLSAGLGWFGYHLWRTYHRVSAIVLILPALVIGVGGFAVKMNYRAVLFPETTQVMTEEMWQYDITQLVEALENKYPNSKYNTSVEDVKLSLNSLEQSLNGKTDNQIKLELMRIISQLNDGHSIIPPQPGIDFHVLPYITHKFKDGVYIINTSKQLEAIKGAKLTHIGKYTIEDVFNRLVPYIGGENRGQKWDRFPLYGGMTELLFELGIADSPTSVTIRLEKDDNTLTQQVEAKPYYQFALFYFFPKQHYSSLPYEHSFNSNHYWHEMRDDNLMYVNINNTHDSAKQTLKQFSRLLEKAIDENQPTKLVLDLRQNRGGDNFKSRAVLKVLRDSSSVNQPGKLYVLTSPRTYSAAVNLTAMLKNQTHAILVGQPTGAGPNHYGDSKGIKLNNSGIWVALSTVEWRSNFVDYSPDSITPDHQVSYQYSDYLNNHDPAMAFVINHQPVAKQPTSEVLPSQRYLTDAGQLVELVQKNTQWYLKADDYAEYSVNRLFTPIFRDGDKYRTGISNIRINPIPNGYQIVANGKVIPLTPVSEDYIPPFKQLFMEQISDVQQGVARLKLSEAYRYLYQGTEYKYRQYGYQHYDNKRYEHAKAIFDFVKHITPGYTYAHSRYGMAQFKLGDIDGANKSFQQALELGDYNQTAKDMSKRLQQEVTK